jgi:uncharacterized protein (TIGR02145 family)
MLNIKAIFIGFTAVSICMAAIIGKVMDISGNAISGAVVQLEKENQSVITSADGSFTLSYTGVKGQGKQIAKFNCILNAKGNLLRLNLVEKSPILITTFNLSGKVLSTNHVLLESGTHSIAFPKSAPGVYFYKVKTSNQMFLLKSTSLDGISLNTNLADRGTFINNELNKKANVSSLIKGVISVTKNGYLNQRITLPNSDTSGIEIKMIVCAGTVTDGNGDVYQTVKIGKQEWMAENLRAIKYIDGTDIPFDTSTVSWADTANKTPKYCYYSNMTNADSNKRYGALYNWYVVNPENPKKIVPAGWHVPTNAEWDTLQNYLIANGYNYDSTTTGNKIAKALAAKADWVMPLPQTLTGWIGDDLARNNSSGFSAYPSGSRNKFGYFGTMEDHFNNCGWWSSTEYDESDAFANGLSDMSYELKRVNGGSKYGGCSIRLVKDN